MSRPKYGCRKYSFTLIEVLISSFLAGILVSITSIYIHFVLDSQRQISKKSQECLQLQYTYQRLWRLFDRIPIAEDTSSALFQFEDKAQSLLWQSNLSPDLHTISQAVLKLYVENEQLVLDVCDNRNSIKQREVLLTHVQNVQLCFDSKPGSNSFVLKDPSTFPRFVQFSIKFLALKQPQEFVFCIGNCKQPVQLPAIAR